MRWLGLLLLGVIVAGCGDDRLGQRYRAERELWRADQARLDLPAPRAGDARFDALAARFEGIGSRYQLADVADSAALEVQEVAGRAWLDAVEIHLGKVDSLRAVNLLDQLPARFDVVPAIGAEIAWRRGRIARARGNGRLALERYGHAVELLPPDPGAGGAADSVHYLPLEMLRLADQNDLEDARPDLDQWVIDYYRGCLETDSLDVYLDARRLLAEVHIERARWADAIRQLGTLERELHRQAEFEEGLPRYEPHRIRLRQFEARAAAWVETQDPLDSLRVHFDRLREDYDDYGLAPPALWMMARAAQDRGLTETALDLMSRLRLRYGRAEVAPAAVLARARLLEREQRWRDAYLEYQLLATEHPLSEAGLRVPLEIVDHHIRREDQLSAQAALIRAEAHYRETLRRYPAGAHANFARERLIETLERMMRYDEAVHEILELSQRFSGRPAELRLWRRAALLMRRELPDLAQYRSLLDRIVQRYPSTLIGEWATAEIGRLDARSGEI